jgi:hypothetical protein
VTDELIRLARWLEAQPWNRPGSDKTWVLRSMWTALTFQWEIGQAERAADA